MKYLSSYQIFESAVVYNDLMGKLLHLYGSIPVIKQKASIVIKKIVWSTNKKYFELGQDVNINYYKQHDKIRFADYFDSLLSDKDSRGHNFEGLICGLFGGDLSERGSKFDLKIENERFSVKFVDHKSKAPEIGRFKNLIEGTPLDDIVVRLGGLTRIFKSGDEQLKLDIWNRITSGIDKWILAYPDDITNPQFIQLNIVDKEEMFRLINSGHVVAPKGGYQDIYSLALSSRYITSGNYESSKISIPYVSLGDLQTEIKDILEDKWANSVFGEMASKIRPDVIRWIKVNKETVIKRLSES